MFETQASEKAWKSTSLKINRTVSIELVQRSDGASCLNSGNIFVSHPGNDRSGMMVPFNLVQNVDIAGLNDEWLFRGSLKKL